MKHKLRQTYDLTSSKMAKVFEEDEGSKPPKQRKAFLPERNTQPVSGNQFLLEDDEPLVPRNVFFLDDNAQSVQRNVILPEDDPRSLQRNAILTNDAPPVPREELLLEDYVPPVQRNVFLIEDAASPTSRDAFPLEDAFLLEGNQPQERSAPRYTSSPRMKSRRSEKTRSQASRTLPLVLNPRGKEQMPEIPHRTKTSPPKERPLPDYELLSPSPISSQDEDGERRFLGSSSDDSPGFTRKREKQVKHLVTNQSRFTRAMLMLNRKIKQALRYFEASESGARRLVNSISKAFGDMKTYAYENNVLIQSVLRERESLDQSIELWKTSAAKSAKSILRVQNEKDDMENTLQRQLQEIQQERKKLYKRILKLEIANKQCRMVDEFQEARRQQMGGLEAECADLKRQLNAMADENDLLKGECQQLYKYLTYMKKDLCDLFKEFDGRHPNAEVNINQDQVHEGVGMQFSTTELTNEINAEREFNFEDHTEEVPLKSTHTDETKNEEFSENVSHEFLLHLGSYDEFCTEIKEKRDLQKNVKILRALIDTLNKKIDFLNEKIQEKEPFWYLIKDVKVHLPQKKGLKRSASLPELTSKSYSFDDSDQNENPSKDPQDALFCKLWAHHVTAMTRKDNMYVLDDDTMSDLPMDTSLPNIHQDIVAKWMNEWIDNLKMFKFFDKYRVRSADSPRAAKPKFDTRLLNDSSENLNNYRHSVKMDVQHEESDNDESNDESVHEDPDDDFDKL